MERYTATDTKLAGTWSTIMVEKSFEVLFCFCQQMIKKKRNLDGNKKIKLRFLLYSQRTTVNNFFYINRFWTAKKMNMDYLTILPRFIFFK